MRFTMYYSSSDTSDMQIRIFLGNFLRYTILGDPIKKLSFWIRCMLVISLKLKNISEFFFLFSFFLSSKEDIK